jgi:hypothetical protein
LFINVLTVYYLARPSESPPLPEKVLAPVKKPVLAPVKKPVYKYQPKPVQVIYIENIELDLTVFNMNKLD